MEHLEVRRVSKYVFDLFYGTQWDQWSRVKKGRSSTYVVQGQHLPKPELHRLHEILDPRMPITYGQSVDEMLFNFQYV